MLRVEGQREVPDQPALGFVVADRIDRPRDLNEQMRDAALNRLHQTLVITETLAQVFCLADVKRQIPLRRPPGEHVAREGAPIGRS